MTGVTFAGSLADPDAAERHTQQYFENFGNRAMYKDGWWLSMRMPRTPWRLDPELLKRFAPGVWDPDEDPVELYYLPDDFSQATDLAASNPDKVKELQDLFWEEAEKYNIKPLLAGFSPFFGIVPPPRSHYGPVRDKAANPQRRRPSASCCGRRRGRPGRGCSGR
jgi:arylsulfatase A-like enzyme